MIGYRYKGKVYTAKQIEFIRECVNNNWDVSVIEDPRMTPDQMGIIVEGYRRGYNVKCYAYFSYSFEQMKIVFNGLSMGLEMDKYTEPDHTTNQTKAIFQKLKSMEVVKGNVKVRVSPKPGKPAPDFVKPEKRRAIQKAHRERLQKELLGSRPAPKPDIVYQNPVPHNRDYVEVQKQSRDFPKTSRMKITWKD